MWLWDSCFHAVVWGALGDAERAVRELRTALAGQDPLTGFVPHMAYHGAGPVEAADAAAFWGSAGADRVARSTITQPPMFGHAVAELVRRGIDVPEDLVDRSVAGLRFLMRRRRRGDAGLIELVHPWESGCDDSPRWDDVVAGTWSVAAWHVTKGTLLGSIERSPSGAPIGNAAFAIESVGFNALVAFNALELAGAIDDGPLAAGAEALVTAIDRRWEPALATWVDGGVTAEGSGRCRTLDSLLPLLVIPRPDAFAALADPTAFGAPYGPRGVHLAEAVHDPGSYWRGPAWPQLSYLLWLAAQRHGRHGLAARIGRSTGAAALMTGLAEYWDGDTGTGGGATPQSWSALSLLMTPG